MLLRVGGSDPHPHLSWASSCRPIPSMERRASACLGAVGAGAGGGEDGVPPGSLQLCAHMSGCGRLSGRRTAACFWGCPCCHCGPGHQWAPIGLPGWPEGAVCAHPGGLGMQRTIEGVCGSLSSGEECAHGSCGWACTADELIRACSAAAGRKMTPVSMAHWPRSTKGCPLLCGLCCSGVPCGAQPGQLCGTAQRRLYRLL